MELGRIKDGLWSRTLIIDLDFFIIISLSFENKEIDISLTFIF